MAARASGGSGAQAIGVRAWQAGQAKGERAVHLVSDALLRLRYQSAFSVNDGRRRRRRSNKFRALK
jgi:hypothetical protein